MRKKKLIFFERKARAKRMGFFIGNMPITKHMAVCYGSVERKKAEKPAPLARAFLVGGCQGTI
jgi:hypothetical protein